jgi:hypothetical protein
MKLQNEKCANMKFLVGDEVIQSDAKGVVEISDKVVAKSFLNSGFVKVEGKNEPKVESKKEKKEEKSEEKSAKRESLRGK